MNLNFTTPFLEFALPVSFPYLYRVSHNICRFISSIVVWILFGSAVHDRPAVHASDSISRSIAIIASPNSTLQELAKSAKCLQYELWSLLKMCGNDNESRLRLEGLKFPSDREFMIRKCGVQWTTAVQCSVQQRSMGFGAPLVRPGHAACRPLSNC